MERSVREAHLHAHPRQGARYRAFQDWERDELIQNLVGALKQCDRDIQDRMVHHLTWCDADYGKRVAQGLGR